tara:strand:- start:25698 stop:27050 length:1353 start_codon:yes stop_codon:yes gene_type:complete
MDGLQKFLGTTPKNKDAQLDQATEAVCQLTQLKAEHEALQEKHAFLESQHAAQGTELALRKIELDVQARKALKMAHTIRLIAGRTATLKAALTLAKTIQNDTIQQQCYHNLFEKNQQSLLVALKNTKGTSFSSESLVKTLIALADYCEDRDAVLSRAATTVLAQTNYTSLAIAERLTEAIQCADLKKLTYTRLLSHLASTTHLRFYFVSFKMPISIYPSAFKRLEEWGKCIDANLAHYFLARVYMNAIFYQPKCVFSATGTQAWFKQAKDHAAKAGEHQYKAYAYLALSLFSVRKTRAGKIVECFRRLGLTRIKAYEEASTLINKFSGEGAYLGFARVLYTWLANIAEAHQDNKFIVHFSKKAPAFQGDEFSKEFNLFEKKKAEDALRLYQTHDYRIRPFSRDQHQENWVQAIAHAQKANDPQFLAGLKNYAEVFTDGMDALFPEEEKTA